MGAPGRYTGRAMALSFQHCERARRARDARYDGRFFVAVKTTGIYCRPVCPAPQPQTKNVEYFVSAALAAQAGYRPCLRCRPETAPQSPSWQGTATTVKRALGLIHEGALSEQPLARFAERLGVSDRHLRRLFDEHVGVSPQAYALNHRLLFAKQLLGETGLPVIDVAVASGFQSRRRFNDAFQRQFDLTPSEVRRARAPTGSGLRVKLRYRPPFDYPRMLGFFAARALPGVEHVDGGSYCRTFSVGGRQGWFSLAQVTSDNALTATIHVEDPKDYLPVVQRIRQVFDLDASPTEIRRVLCRDPRLAPHLAKLSGLRIPGIWTEFEAVVRAIVGQQISVQAARTVLSRLCDRFGQPVTGAPGLSRTFPRAESLAKGRLTGLGLTATRAGWVVGAARAYAQGFRTGDGDLQERVQRLTTLAGVGPWSAQYVCLRALQESDAFPATDLGVYKALGLTRGSARQAEALAEAWRPWRGYAVICLWHALGDIR